MSNNPSAPQIKPGVNQQQPPQSPPVDQINDMPDKKNRTPVIIALLTVLLVLIGLASWLLFFAPKPQIDKVQEPLNQNKAKTKVNTPSTIPSFKESDTAQKIIRMSPTPAPKPIPSGKTNFNVSGGKKAAPQFKEGTIDPYDPAQGQKQKITINLESQTPVTKVVSVISTDNQQQNIQMTLVSGDETTGTWEGSWVVDDSYEQNYQLKLTASNAEDAQEATIMLR